MFFLSNFSWNWLEMCGPGGISPWSPSKHDIGACFQQLFLEVPILVIFAAVSAYYFGAGYSRRTNISYRKWTIRARMSCSFFIALIPLVRLAVSLSFSIGDFRPVDYLTTLVEASAWLVHTFYIHTLRHKPSVHGPILVIVLWTSTVSLNIISLRSLVIARTDFTSNIFLGFGIATIVFQVLYGFSHLTECCRSGTIEDQEEVNERRALISSHYDDFREVGGVDDLGIAMKDSSCISKLLFHWVHPLLKKGYENKLRVSESLYDLPDNLSTSYLSNKLHAALNGGPGGDISYTTQHYSRVSLLRALHRCFGLEFYTIGILKFVADVLNFGGPILLNLLVTFVEDKNENAEYGYSLVAALFACTLFACLLNTHFTFLMSRIGLKLRGALVANIYWKTLHISQSTMNSFTLGEIVNFMNTDTDRIVNSCQSFHTFWSIPLQLAVSFYLLYRQVGISFIAGVVFAVLLIPINKLIANKIGSYSTLMMEAKDERVSVMSEVLRGIRVIKIHAWEQYFLEKVMRIRATELKYLKNRKYLDALCVYFWATTPVLVSILTLGTYFLLGHPMTASTVFTTVALLNMLIAPLNAFPWVLNGVVEAWVSVKRVQRLLDAENLNFGGYYSPGLGPISMTKLRVEWDSPQSLEESLAPSGLQDITLSIEKGQLVGVIGGVGSGKTTLIHCLLGELNRCMGEITVVGWEGGFGLVTQTPWLQHKTLRDNILFGKRYDSVRYKEVLDCCCLAQDLEAFVDKDMVRVGEGGCSLSGGQRARIALARAVYQDKDVYLIDDVLAALDPPVARHIYNKVICGLLKNKTRILCTNNVQLLTNADLIVQLNRGCLVNLGKPCDVLQNYDDSAFCDTESMTSYKESRDETSLDPDEDGEVNERGAVKASVYGRYWTSVGAPLALAIIISISLMQVSRNMADYWLSIWVKNANETGYEQVQTSYYLETYLFLAVFNTIFTLLRAFLFAYGGLRSARKIHDKLVKKVMFSKIVFFDLAPLGRILNRFSSDTYTVDDSLPFTTNILFAQVFGLFGALVVTISGLPWLCLVLATLVPIYYYVQGMYRPCARDLKRLSSSTLSPLYSHFTETLQGLVTIHAFRSLTRFQKQNEILLENNQKAVFASFCASTWLSFRLQLLGVAVVTGVAVLAILKHQFDVIEPGIVGLTIAYALAVTSLLSGVVSAFAETEREFVSLERVSQYIDEIQPEVGLELERSLPYAWPSQGVVSFRKVYMRYRPNLLPCLNGVSFITRPAEKIGVVGRTGAGKSSLFAALLKLVPVYSGEILIDEVNVDRIPLATLRSVVAVIPQDPYLFQGSLRSNLDPLGQSLDHELWAALQKCQMKTFVGNLGGLYVNVETNGRNFSLGQKQLFCLVRAVLKKAKVICIDEATASVDAETDQLIQKTIRSCFEHSTVITIAHRISTVMDSDRLLVLSDGEVVNFDTPAALSSDKTSYFYKLYQKTS